MEYVIKTCLLGIKCNDCEHCRPDPERYGDKSCFLNEDLQGEERTQYLLKLLKHFTQKEEK